MITIIFKFIFALVGIFSSTLYLSSMAKSISEANSFINSQNEPDTTKDATFRLIVGIIMSICWAFVIVL